MLLETDIKLPKEIQFKIIMEYWLNQYEDIIININNLWKTYYEIATEHCRMYRDIVYYKRKIKIFDEGDKKDSFSNIKSFESVREGFVTKYEKFIENKQELFSRMTAKREQITNTILEKKNIEMEITKFAHLTNEKELCKKRIALIKKSESNLYSGE